MAINAVAPWEGELVWLGEVNKGKTSTGQEWKSVDFTLRYEDQQMNEKFMTFSVFGVGKVNQLLGYKEGTRLKVLWWPESNQAKNGKYYPKNSVISIYLAEPQVKSADTKITAPSYPQPQPPLPGNPLDDDLPAEDGFPF